jgi:hypothetical protein
MPIHDWTKVDAGLFHDFHQDWTIELRRSLNAGRLPPGYVALTDQQIGGPIPDVLTLHRGTNGSGCLAPSENAGGVAVATIPPKARFVVDLEEDTYAARANRIRIHHRHGEVVAVIEIVSPGNKNSMTALRTFIRKATDLMAQGINLLIVDLFPPSARDPQGIPKAIFDEIGDRQFELPPDKPLTVTAYRAAPVKTAFVEPMAAGDELPSLPIFLLDEQYVPAPLEETYEASWAAFPADFKGLLEQPRG